MSRAREEFSREVAAEGLGEGWAGDVIVRDVLLTLLVDRSHHVREAALAVLREGWIGDPRVRDGFLSMLHSSDDAVREVAAEGLVAECHDDLVAREVLRTLTKDQNPIIRWTAERGILTEKERSPHVSYGGTDTLIAARIPSHRSGGSNVPVISTLRRGISFDSRITMIAGDNGAGKTVLLWALAARLGIKDYSRQSSPLIADLADHLEILWGERPESYHCSFLNERRNEYRSSRSWLDLIEAKARKSRLLLLDAPIGYLPSGQAKSMLEVLVHLSQKCQIIFTSVNHGAYGIPDVIKIVDISRVRIRDHSLFQ
nr:HEAT repeat domain-containing protein [Streptomyces sp. SID1034]